MATTAAKKQEAKLAKNLAHKTHFTKQEIETLMINFKKMTMSKLERTMFREILHNTFEMTDDILMDRIFRTFDADNDGIIDFGEWVTGLSIILRGTQDEKIDFCFKVYDLTGDRIITREEMFHMLKNTMVRQLAEEDPDEGIKDLVDLTLKKMDYDRDGRLSADDFKRSVQEEPLLLEAFGPCLPDDKVREAFLATFTQTKMDTSDSLGLSTL
ncbi:EF-hand calcium-binding domain-containing protein 1-like [Limulus polyphemus]|uniref:EF-hand calcium-binding domain-containing protein 1-like n=1 Tax=Limulus polyphemus TaxID=6850 RepID=A0ABM1SR82_LIMPO|nr:EF-hand calcium-binding domain-containing protein 1-like [Limulus polyphemus]XP_022246138.1 EF-hand calcium-binding domain-containing protein 1-like [Limulus polyphemus]